MEECLKIRKLTKFKSNMVKVSENIAPESCQILQSDVSMKVGMHLPPTIQVCKTWRLSLNNVVNIHVTFKLGIFINFESFLLALLMDSH